MPTDNPTQPHHSGFTNVAISGTAWATGQTIANKFITLIAIWVIARQLTRDEVGAAALAMTVMKFLCVLPPLNMGDVLIAHRRQFGWLGGIGSRLAVQTGITITILSALISPAVASFYSQYPSTLLIGLLVVAAFRPTGEAAQVHALTRLRLDFQNRTIAIIEGSWQLCATVATIIMALAGAGAWAMVLPLIVAIVGKAICYRLRQPRDATIHSEPQELHPRHIQFATRRLRNAFLSTGGAQYLHSVVDTMPLLVLGKWATASETGVYAFAFTLAGQANTMIATQISGVLQPILGHMQKDLHRQVNAYKRAMCMLSAIAIPVCLTQAIFSETLFALVFDARWQPAARVFAVLSICESFFFAAAPTMAMLKAQGRFRTFLAWQGCQLALAAVVFPIAALHGGAFSVALGSAVLWSISLPIAVWLCIRPAGGSIWDALRIFIAPWCTSLPIGVAAYFIAEKLQASGTWGMVFALAITAPIMLAVMLYATRWSQPNVYREIEPMVRKGMSRIPILTKIFRT